MVSLAVSNYSPEGNKSLSLAVIHMYIVSSLFSSYQFLPSGVIIDQLREFVC